MKKMFEILRTESAVAGQVLKGRSFTDSLVPSKRNHVVAQVYRCNCGHGKSHTGTMCPAAFMEDYVHEGWNSRVDGGASWQAGVMGNAAGTPAIYMALAASVSLTLTKTDTYIGGTSNANEIAANGCSRALGVYAYAGAPTSIGGATSYTISKTFTCTTAPQAVGSVALVTNATLTTVFVEANLGTVASLAVSDSVAITYTINL